MTAKESVVVENAGVGQLVLALVLAATKVGEVTGVIQAAGVSPSQASPATILKVDLFGTAVLLEEFGNVKED